MYGFSKELNIDAYLGDSINLFAVYKFGIILTFHSGRSITIEYRLQILDNNHNLVNDIHLENGISLDSITISPFLNSNLIKYEIIESERLILRFESGYSIIIYDNHDYESCTIDEVTTA